MEKTFKWAVIAIMAIVMCGCTSKKEEKYKIAEDYYSSHGYNIIQKTTANIPYDIDNPDNYYILFEKDGFIYLDTEFKKNGSSAKKIYPNETGLNINFLLFSLSNGISGSLEPIDISPYGFDDNLYGIKDASIIFTKCSKNDDPQNNKILWITFNDGEQFFYLLGSKEVLSSTPISIKWDYKYSPGHTDNSYPSDVILEEEYTFGQLYHLSEYELDEYPVTIEECFSLKDLSFTGFTGRAILKKSDYPVEKIHQVLGSYPEIKEDQYCFYIPLNTTYFDVIKQCLDESVKEYEAEMLREQQRAQIEQYGTLSQKLLAQPTEEDMYEFINENTTDFSEMMDEFRNPIKAEKKYVPGTEVILRIRADEIEFGGGTYPYRIKHNAYNSAEICSDQEEFADLDYPIVIWVLVNYKGVKKDSLGYCTYEFIDAILLGCKKPSVWD